MLPVVNPQHVASGAGAADRSQEAGARQAEGLAEDPTPESSLRGHCTSSHGDAQVADHFFIPRYWLWW
jgi:hypothetical protein